MRTIIAWGLLQCGWIGLSGALLLCALLPLIKLPSLSGAGVYPFLVCFCASGAAYVLALLRLPREEPSLRLIWIFAVLFRVTMLLTPVTLSDDVYRYIWDGHLLNQGVNPYAEPVNSPLLDPYTTLLRERVNFPWMATPYLPAAQGYFGLVEQVAPQSTFAFQLGAAALDLAACGLIVLVLGRLKIAQKAVLVYLWNPLVVIEFAHGAHIDALMIFFISAGLLCIAWNTHGSRTLAALFWAAAVLIKGWPVVLVPMIARRLGWARLILFVLACALPLAGFAAAAGWGISGPADGRGLFGAVRIYSASWEFNSGLYYWIAKVLSGAGARLVGLAAPGLCGLYLGWLAYRRERSGWGDPLDRTRSMVRAMLFPVSLFLILAPTVHPWYITLVFALLPFFWPGEGEAGNSWCWVWPWVYFLFFEAFTYLSYTEIQAPTHFALIRTAAYLPFWGLLAWAAIKNLRGENESRYNI